MRIIVLILTIFLFSCGEPIAVTKCKGLIGKKVLINTDTLTIVNYTYSLSPFDNYEDKFELSNGLKIDYDNIDKFLINDGK